MDTRPIISFLNELESRKRYYALFPNDTKEEAAYIFGCVLNDLEKEFKECIFQCAADNKAFKEQMQIVARKLETLSDNYERIKKSTPDNYDDSYEAARLVALESLAYLKENYNIAPDLVTLDNDISNEVAKKPAKAAFLSLEITKAQASKLYDKLVAGGYLADTGKNDFIYYFTGCGGQPNSKLVWKSKQIILAFLLFKLSSDTLQWKQLGEIFDGVNPTGMKTALSDRLDERFDEGTAASKHWNRINEDWLK